MNMILVSASASTYNDERVGGLVFFLEKALLSKEKLRIAVFQLDDKYIKLYEGEKETGMIKADETGKQPPEESARYRCVRKLMMTMDRGDHLMCGALSDLGDTAEEVSALYFAFLEKGIDIQFYDGCLLDSASLELEQPVTAEARRIIDRQIKKYFTLENHYPQLTGKELEKVSSLSTGKKK